MTKSVLRVARIFFAFFVLIYAGFSSAWAVKTQSTTVLTASPNPVLLSGASTLTATVTGASPTGLVVFYDESYEQELGRVALQNGVATLVKSSSVSGFRAFSARYLGDVQNEPSLSPKISHLTRLYVGSPIQLSAATVAPGESYILTMSGIDPTCKSVSVYAGQSGSMGAWSGHLEPVNGVATWTGVAPTYSPVWIHAAYNDESCLKINHSDWAILNVSTNPSVKSNAAVSVYAIQNPIPLGENITLIAQVLGKNPTGVVKFSTGWNSNVAVALTNGMAFYTFYADPNKVGARSMSVQYSGDDNNNPANGSSSRYRVIPVVTLTSSAQSVTTGADVTFTASALGYLVAGTVNFMDGNTLLKAVPLTRVTNFKATAVFTTSFPASSTRNIHAVYQGTSNFESKASPSVSVSVIEGRRDSAVTLTASPASVYLGQDAWLTAVVTGASPTGTVEFRDGSTVLGSAPMNSGVASINVKLPILGAHNLTAVYAGDIAHNGSTSSVLSFNVKAKSPSSVALSASPSSATVGQPMTFTASVSGVSPTGTVNFKRGASTIGTASISSGKAVWRTSSLPIGSQAVTAEYGGDASNAASLSSSVTITVINATTTMSNYAVFGVDANQDGCVDYLIRTKDGSPPTSIFMLLSSAGCQYTLTQTISTAQAGAAWVASPYKVIVGDVKGDGNGSILLVPTNASGSNVFNVTRAADKQTFTLLQTIAVSKLVSDPATAFITLRDLNLDKRTDLVVNGAGGLLDVFLSQADGQLVLAGADNRAAAASLTWKNFIQRVELDMLDDALKYVDEDRKSEMRASMTEADADLPGFASSIKQFEILEETQAAQVTGVVVFERDNERAMYLVRFAKNKAGIWKIVAM